MTTPNLTLDGSLEVTACAGFGPGVYTLFEWVDGIIDNGLVIGSMPPGYLGVLSVDNVSNPKTVKLTVTYAYPCLGALPNKSLTFCVNKVFL